ncbi:MAG: sugar-binding domain-containing protein [Pseudomonadota bacterium]
MSSGTKLTRRRRRAQTELGVNGPVIEAAWLYYHDGLNQNEIAARMGLSRATVVSYLQKARTEGYVKTALAEHVFTQHRSSVALCAAYGLTAAYVVADDRTELATMHRVARGAAQWLPGLLKSGDRLGVAWGRTVHAVAAATDRHPEKALTVLQLVGSVATADGFAAETCSTMLADKLGAACTGLHCPAVVSDASLADRLRAEPIIAAQLDAVGTCNKAVFAAGSATPKSHIVAAGVTSLQELDVYRARGAVGVHCARFVDTDGKPVAGPLDDRIMGVTLDRLTGLDMGLMVSCGPEKVDPMRALMRGGFVTHLVTAQSTAEALLLSG